MSASVLFDAPGPKARRRHLILTGVGGVLAVAAAWVVLRKMASASQLERYMWEPFVTDPQVWTEYLLVGLVNTLKAAVLSVALAGVFGLVFGMGRLAPNRGVRWVCGAVVEFFRSVPVLMLMIFLFFGYFAHSTLVPSEFGPLVSVVIALTLYNGSVIAELVRSGVHSLPNGQHEAGLSIGLTQGQTLRIIQLPQALTAMLPALIGQFVVVLKDTALGIAITFPELLSWGKTLGSAYANTVPAYIVVAVLFILLNYSLTKVAQYVERRLKQRGHNAAPITTTVPTIVGGTGEPGAAAEAGARIMVEGVEEAADRVRAAADKARRNRDDPGW